MYIWQTKLGYKCKITQCGRPSWAIYIIKITQCDRSSRPTPTVRWRSRILRCRRWRKARNAPWREAGSWFSCSPSSRPVNKNTEREVTQGEYNKGRSLWQECVIHACTPIFSKMLLNWTHVHHKIHENYEIVSTFLEILPVYFTWDCINKKAR